jgi:hypothetical protein
MNMASHQTHPFWKSRGAVAMLGFGAIASFFMLSEHRAHFLGVLPFLLLLACPAMHLFMHHGHHHRTDGSAEQTEPKGEHDERPS